MKLSDLIEKPAHECTVEELEERLRKIRSMQFEKPKTTKKRTQRAPRSNKEKRADSLLRQLSPEERLELAKLIAAKKGGLNGAS